jgi:hypothetical protein
VASKGDGLPELRATMDYRHHLDHGRCTEIERDAMNAQVGADQRWIRRVQARFPRSP